VEHNTPPPPGSWEPFFAVVKEELIWILQTASIITLSLAISRLVQKLTGSGAIDPSAFASTWNEQINHAVRRREETDGNNGQPK